MRALDKNPLLVRRPDLITSSSQNTMHFKFDEPEAAPVPEAAPLVSEHAEDINGGQNEEQKDFLRIPNSL